VPADPSSSIPAALTQLAHADPLGPADGPHLLAYLATIGDPRRPSGRRHPLVVSRWAKEGKLPFLKTLGGHRRYPEAEIRDLAEELREEP
jgi:hypothetical protein